MGSNGTKQADGIAQTITHLIVHGMVLLVTMTHLTLKQLCWPITIWKAPSQTAFGKFETYSLCAYLEIHACEDTSATFCLEI